MRVIAKPRIREFWESRKDNTERERARRALLAWYKLVEKVHCGNWAELKETFGSVDRVGNCIVFDIAGNQYRLIARIFFGPGSSRLYILKVMDHGEYDKQDWIHDCGCHKPPPK